MTRKNHAGTLSLLCASAGFAVLEALRHFGLAASPGWGVLQAGFEAGMVGGFADWFAVSALFRPIPGPRWKIWHTDLIVEKRATLSAGIVDMVQNRWLSQDTLAEHLGRLQVSRFLLEHLDRPAARSQAAAAARDLLGRLAGSLDAPEIAAFLDRALRDQLEGLALGPAFGGWLRARVETGDTAVLWDFLAATLARGAEQGDFKAPIRAMLEAAAADYKGRGTWQRLKAVAGEWFFDYGQLSESLSLAFAASLRALGEDPGHPLRAKLDGHLLAFAGKLAGGDPDACATLDAFQRRMVAHAELGPFLSAILARLQGTLEAQLADPGAPLSHLLERLLDHFLGELREGPAIQARLDAWARRTILELAQRNHGLIGEMVAGSLDRLSPRDLVAQIEDKVGADLQYIRLNGAVVGSLVGMALALVKLLAR